jgi:hypothetical protein
VDLDYNPALETNGAGTYFNLFLDLLGSNQDERETVKADLIKAGEESPSIGTPGKELGLRWKNSVSAETKQKYEEKEAEAKASYVAQLASYTPSMEFLQKK